MDSADVVVVVVVAEKANNVEERLKDETRVVTDGVEHVMECLMVTVPRGEMEGASRDCTLLVVECFVEWVCKRTNAEGDAYQAA